MEETSRQNESTIYGGSTYDLMVQRAIASGAVAEGIGYAEYNENQGVGSSFAYFWFDVNGLEVGRFSVMTETGTLFDQPQPWSEESRGRLRHSKGFGTYL